MPLLVQTLFVESNSPPALDISLEFVKPQHQLTCMDYSKSYQLHKTHFTFYEYSNSDKKIICGVLQYLLGIRCLCMRCYNDYYYIIVFIYQKDIDVNAVGSDGKTALLLACEEGYIDIVKRLLDNGKLLLSMVNSRCLW